MAHTPGPWHRNIKPAHKYNTIFAGQNTHVAHLAVQGLSDEEIEANCNLITAAPDLLAACRAFAALWPILPGRTEPKATPEVLRAWRLATAAIAKATA